MSAPASARSRDVAAVVLAAGSSSRLGTPKQLLRYRGETLLHRTVRLALAAGLDPVHVVLGCCAPAVGEALEDLGSRVTTVINPDWKTGMGSSLARGIASLPAAGTGTRSVCDEGARREHGVSVGSCRPGTGNASLESGAAGPQPNAVAAIRPAAGARLQPGSEPGADAPAAPVPGAALVLVTDQPRVSHGLLAEIAAAFRTGGAPLVASRYDSGAVGVPALFARRYFPDLTRITGDRGARVLFTRYHDDMVTVAFPEGDLDIDTRAAAVALDSE